MVDAIARGRFNPQVATHFFLLYSFYITVWQRRTILRVRLEMLEQISVTAIESGWRAKPHEATVIFQDAINLAGRQPITSAKRLE